jgi:hypothetical protein
MPIRRAEKSPSPCDKALSQRERGQLRTRQDVLLPVLPTQEILP